jgi:hypothetical protein
MRDRCVDRSELTHGAEQPHGGAHARQCEQERNAGRHKGAEREHQDDQGQGSDMRMDLPISAPDFSATALVRLSSPISSTRSSGWAF